MAQAPAQRTLYCAYSNDLTDVLSIDCVPDKDFISHVQQRVWETDREIRELLPRPGLVRLYCPKGSLEHGVTEENIAPLSFHQRVSASFPKSGDEHIDVIIKRPEVQQAPTDKKESPDYNPKETCRRDATVSRLARILDDQRLVYIRGTPTSGRTTLAFLLLEYYHSKGRRAFYRSSWKPLDESTVWKSFAEHFGCPEDKLEGTVFILDEAQKSYNDVVFWNRIIKCVDDRARNIKICLFSSYGSPVTGLPHDPETMTPAFIQPPKRVSLTPTLEPGTPEFGLFFDQDEFDDAVTRLSNNQSEKFNLGEKAKDYIFKITNGHPAAVKAVVLYMFELYRSEFKADHFNVITEDGLLRALKDEYLSVISIARFSISRSLPYRGSIDLTADAQAVLKRVLEDGNIPFDDQNPGIKTCYEFGWVQRTLQQGQDVCVLPSAFHAKYMEYLLDNKKAQFPDEKFPTLQSLCKAVIGNFSAKNLRLYQEGKKVSTAEKIQPPETQYQDEFYRAFNSVAPGIRLSSEWPRTGNIRFDFWIEGKKWGIELLKDHDRAQEHCDRFKKGGQYYSWIEEGKLKEWIVIDCATSPTVIEPCPEQNLWRAIFKEDFTEVQLFDNTNNPLTDPIALTDN